MHLVLVLLALAIRIQAGTIQGVVLEQVSGRPLARTVVRLNPVPQSSGTSIQPLVTRGGRTGQFVFQAVTPGLYLLNAVHGGYFPVAYGQRLPIGRGTPIQVTADSDLFAELRMRRKGAVTGRVLDENGVATAGVPVLAYRARLPLRSAGSGLSDDRGVFRIFGLDPGKYWVRSGAHTLSDGSGWLPTFGAQGREVREALTHRVTVDADTTDADVNPEPGSLFHLGGLLACNTPAPVLVTLSSETGRRSTEASCLGGYRFEGLAPAGYEVFATLKDGTAAGFIELSVARDYDAATIQIQQAPTVDIEVRRAGSNVPVDVPVRLTGRRQDLSEIEPEHEITGRRTTLAPGHWQFRAQVPSGQYVESIVHLYGAARRPQRAESASGWYEVFIESRAPSKITITVSDRAGQIASRVMTDSKPVPGAPVFLWPVADSTRRSLAGRALQTLSDTEGRFRFDSLPPGDYRLLASFDVYEIDEEVIELSGAVVVHAEASQTVTIEAPVWIAP
jgi:hypothetical protein